LKRKQPNPEPFLERVRKSRDASYHFDSARPEFPAVDIDYCTSLDRFDFAMPVIQENGHFVIQPVYF